MKCPVICLPRLLKLLKYLIVAHDALSNYFAYRKHRYRHWNRIFFVSPSSVMIDFSTRWIVYLGTTSSFCCRIEHFGLFSKRTEHYYFYLHLPFENVFVFGLWKFHNFTQYFEYTFLMFVFDLGIYSSTKLSHVLHFLCYESCKLK